VQTVKEQPHVPSLVQHGAPRTHDAHVAALQELPLDDPLLDPPDDPLDELLEDPPDDEDPMQEPPWQLPLPAHANAAPQPPQLLSSLVKSTQPPLHEL